MVDDNGETVHDSSSKWGELSLKMLQIHVAIYASVGTVCVAEYIHPHVCFLPKGPLKSH